MDHATTSLIVTGSTHIRHFFPLRNVSYRTILISLHPQESRERRQWPFVFVDLSSMLISDWNFASLICNKATDIRYVASVRFVAVRCVSEIDVSKRVLKPDNEPEAKIYSLGNNNGTPLKYYIIWTIFILLVLWYILLQRILCFLEYYYNWISAQY